MTSVVSEVEEALTEAQAIRNVIEKLEELKDKELRKFLGISDDESSESDRGEESDTDNEGSDVDDYSRDKNRYNINNDGSDSNRLMAVLKQCNFNLQEFVSQIQTDKPKIDKNTMNSLLEDFAAELPNLAVSEHNNLIQQSRQVYQEQQLLLEQQNDIADGMIVLDKESDNPDEYLHVREPLDNAGRTLIMKRRAAIHRKEISKRK